MNAQRNDTENLVAAEQSLAPGSAPLPVPIARALVPAKGGE